MSAAGISTINSACTKLASPVAFSNGIAELTLKKPPPTDPIVLITTCDATGPSTSVCSPPARVPIVTGAASD